MVRFDVKGANALFFDRAAVTNAMDAATRRALSRFGAFVRTRARSSIRTKKGVSPPGGPPYSHTGSLKRFIFFAYEAAARRVVIGPVRLGGVKGKDVPHTLEYGGTEQGNGREIFITNAVGRDQRGRFTSQGKRRVTLQGTVTYRPRPFMHPALAKELPGLPALWKNSIR